MTEKEWINLIATDAQKAANEYGYLPSVLIAQTCQENGYGTDPECAVLVEVNNLLGMKRELLNSTWKSNYWHGVCITKRTPEWYNGKKTYITDDFRSYSSILDCFYDYCQFMRDARYSPGGGYKYRDLLGTKDPYTLIEGVRSRGYCTDPEYSRAIMRIIKKHDLTQYDSTKKEEAKKMERPEVTDKLWHVGASSGFSYKHPDARNYNTIGIECACYSIGDRWFFTKATQEACARLAAWIMSEYGIPMDHLLRHGDITTKHCPSPYIDNPGDGPNWTWEQFKARVAEYLVGTSSDTKTEYTGTQALVAAGQQHSINFTGVTIEVDGIRGAETTRNMVRCLQRAANLDWQAGLVEDGFIGPRTEAAFEGHYIKYGESQKMVTAVEIICYCLGRDPKGVEYPGKFGSGLAAALGTQYLSGEDILALVD